MVYFPVQYSIYPIKEHRGTVLVIIQTSVFDGSLWPSLMPESFNAHDRVASWPEQEVSRRA